MNYSDKGLINTIQYGAFIEVNNGGITEGPGDPGSDIQSLIKRLPKEPIFLNC